MPAIWRYSVWIVVLLFQLAAACGNAQALSLDMPITRLRHTVWTEKEGAPGGIQALAQTQDGYLWIGSPDGLHRFDGLRFESYDLPQNPGLSSVAVYSLFAPGSGGLWIGFTFGGAAFLKDGQLIVYGERDGLPQGSIKAFAQDRLGRLWASATRGLLVFEAGRWRLIGAESSFPEKSATDLLLDSAGTLWVVAQTAIYSLADGQTQFHAEGPLESRTAVLAESSSGSVWLYDRGDVKRIGMGHGGHSRILRPTRILFFDQDDGLWVHKLTGGIERLSHPESWVVNGAIPEDTLVRRAQSTEGPLPLGGPSILFEDRERNVWVASLSGLERFAESNTRRLDIDGVGLSPFSSGFTAAEDSGLWIFGLSKNALYRAQGGALVQQPVALDGPLWASSPAIDGVSWFGADGLLLRHASGRFEKIETPEGTAESSPQAITQDPMHRVWLSVVRKGVFRRSGDQWSVNGGITALPMLTAITLATDREGRIWLGYTDGRMARVDRDDGVTLFTEDHALPIGNVTAIEGRRAHLWAGGELGLALFDGTRFHNLLAENGMTFKSVTGIVETAAGDLWLNAAAGIQHIESREIAAAITDPAYRVHAESFDVLDGILGTGARVRPLPTAAEAADGVLWFITTFGLYSIDPAHLHRNPVPPVVQIESVTVDGKTLSAHQELDLPMGASALRFDYAGLSLTMAERVRFRYQLEGVDKDWQDGQTRREAFYTNLDPGRYRFRVMAANNDGIWSPTAASVDIHIPPAFVQTGWFIALCIAGAATLVWLMIRVRVAQLGARLRLRLEERVGERERIARELHDTLLQGTQGLILSVQAAATHVPESNPVRSMLDRALDRADTVMAEARDRIQDLRAPAQQLAKLPEALTSLGDELACGKSIVFQATVEGFAEPLPFEVHDEIYRIVREALFNAFQHAGATAIELQLIYEQKGIRIRIRDDGVGIDPDVLAARARPGHWGLRGMQERAELIGASLRLWSRTGAGTEVEVWWPAREDTGLATTVP